MIEYGKTFTVGGYGYERPARYATVTVEGHPTTVIVVGDKFYGQCGRCENATGALRWAAHVYQGQCFECQGAGHGKFIAQGEAEVVKVLTRRAKARARAAAKREAKAEAKHAEQQAKVAAWRAANPEAAALVDEYTAALPAAPAWSAGAAADERHEMALYDLREQWGAFIYEMVTTAPHRPLSEAQTAALVKAHGDRVAREAAKAEQAATARHLDAEVGAKVTVTGTVVVATSIETAYGMSRLVVVAGDGDAQDVEVKVFGSGATLWDVAKGDVVTLTGAVKAHDEYDGKPQTVLTRVKAKVVEAAQG